jgi:hypothetical protein
LIAKLLVTAAASNDASEETATKEGAVVRLLDCRAVPWLSEALKTAGTAARIKHVIKPAIISRFLTSFTPQLIFPTIVFFTFIVFFILFYSQESSQARNDS